MRNPLCIGHQIAMSIYVQHVGEDFLSPEGAITADFVAASFVIDAHSFYLVLMQVSSENLSDIYL